MTVAAVLALGGCASNDEAIAETEDVQPAVTHTILARIDNSGNTRVAINGLKLRWEEGDEIGVVYSYGSGPFEIRKYTFAGLTEDGSAAKFTTTDTPTSSDIYSYAYYPYSLGDKVEDVYKGVVSVDYFQKLGPDKVVVPMLSESTNFNMPDELTFKAVGSLLAVKVKDLPADKFSKAFLCTRDIYLGGGTFSSTGYTAKLDALDLDYDISGLSGSQTFYVPLPAGDIEGLQLMLQGTSAETVYVNFQKFTSTANTKYVKAIQMKEDGTRDKSALALANCKLEATNTVVADFGEETSTSSASFKIPQNQEVGNEETVKLTVSNCRYEGAKIVEGDQDFSGAVTAENVEVIDGGGNSIGYEFSLPNSNVILNATENTTANLTVSNAKSFTIGEKITTYNAKVNCALEELNINGSMSSGKSIKLNGIVSKIDISNNTGSSKYVTLKVADGVTIGEITIEKSVLLSIDYSGSDVLTIKVNGTEITFDSASKVCYINGSDVTYGYPG
jgi:hypothetical protein